MTLSLTEHILDLKGCPLHYWEGGKPSAPWVILLHGACVDHHSFDPVLPIIGETYRVLAWDARGHGSSQPMGQAFTVPLAVEDLVALMDTLDIPSAVIVGHSNGSYVGQELAFRHPERVRALVVADGTCITWQRSAFESFLVNISPALFNLYPFETLKKASLPYASNKPDVQQYEYDAFSRLTKKNFVTLWSGITRCLHPEPDYRITQPLLLIHGENDTMGDIKKIAPLWAKREPDCKYVVIPNTMHFMVMEEPEIFAAEVLKFIDSLKSRS